MSIELILMPLVGMFIGWVTNMLAVKLIFKPYLPIKIPLTPYKIQGLVPKRRAELANKIGQVVERELLSAEDIMKQMRSPEMVDRLVQSVHKAVKNLIEEKVPLWLPPSLKNTLTQIVLEAVNSSVPHLVERSIDKMGEEFIQKIKIADLVEDKLNHYPIEDIERIIVSVAAKELKHIEVLGAVLGFIVGLLQYLILQLL
ncbi:DUF445 family protein [Peptococcaceae bacterium 1198_IL3148]